MCEELFSLYILFGSITGGMPGTVTTGPWRAGVAAGDVAAADAAAGASGALTFWADTHQALPANAAATAPLMAIRLLYVFMNLVIFKIARSIKTGRSALLRQPDRGHCLVHHQIDADLAQRGAGRARVAVDADAAALLRVGRHLLQPHQRRIDGQHQRGVGAAGVQADLRRAQALGPQRLHVVDVGRLVILGNKMRARRRG